MFKNLSIMLLLFGGIFLFVPDKLLAQENRRVSERQEKFIGELINRLGMTELAEEQIQAYERSFPRHGKQTKKMQAMILRRKAANESDFEKKTEALAKVIGILKQILTDLPADSPDHASIAAEIAQTAGAYAIVVGDNINRAELSIPSDKKKKYIEKAVDFLNEALKYYDDAAKLVKAEIDRMSEERDEEAPPTRREQNRMTMLMEMDLNRSDLLQRLSILYFPDEVNYLEKMKTVDKRMEGVRDNHSEDMLGVYLSATAYSIKKKIYLAYITKNEDMKAVVVMDEMNELIFTALEPMHDKSRMEERQARIDMARPLRIPQEELERIQREEKTPIYMSPQQIATMSPVMHMTYLRLMTEEVQMHLALKNKGKEKQLDQIKAIFTEVSNLLPNWEKLEGPSAECARELLFERANWLKESGRAEEAEGIWYRLVEMGGRVGEGSKDKLRGGTSFVAQQSKAGELFRAKKYEEAGKVFQEMLRAIPQSLPNRIEKELEITRLMIISFDEVARAANDTASCDRVIALCKSAINKFEGDSYRNLAQEDLRIITTIYRNCIMLKKQRNPASVSAEDLEKAIIIRCPYFPDEDNSYNLGLLAYQQSKIKDARKCFEAVAKESPKYTDAQIMIARCYFDLAQDARKNKKDKESKELMDKRLDVLKTYLAYMNGKTKTEQDSDRDRDNIQKIEFEVDMTNAQTMIVDGEYLKALKSYKKLSKKYKSRERDMNEQILRLHATTARNYFEQKQYNNAILHLQGIEEYLNKIVAVDPGWKEQIKYIDYLAQMWRKISEANNKEKLGLRHEFNNIVADWYYKSYGVHKEMDPGSVNLEFIKKIIYYLSGADKKNSNHKKYGALIYDLYKEQLKAMNFEGLPYAGDEDVVSREEMDNLVKIEVEVFPKEERGKDPQKEEKFKEEYLKLVNMFFPEKKEGEKSDASIGINYFGVLKSYKKMQGMYPSHKVLSNPKLSLLVQVAEERNNAIKLIASKLLPRAKEMKNNSDREAWLLLFYDYYHDKQAVLDLAQFYEEIGDFKRAKDYYAETYNLCVPDSPEYIECYCKFIECAWNGGEKELAIKQAAYFKIPDNRKKLTTRQQKLIGKIIGGE